MRGKISKTSSFAAFVLIVVNLFVMTCCLLLLAAGIWMTASPSTLADFIQSHGSTAVKALIPRGALGTQPGLGATLLAVVLLIISVMGLRGATSRSPFLLLMYAAIVLLLLLLECALFYYFTTEIQQKGLQEQDGAWTHALRLVFRCCEHNATTFPPQGSPPWSCCDPGPGNCTILQVYQQDCQKTITSWTARYQSVAYTSLTVLHVVLASCSLARRARSVVSLSVS